MASDSESQDEPRLSLRPRSPAVHTGPAVLWNSPRLFRSAAPSEPLCAQQRDGLQCGCASGTFCLAPACTHTHPLSPTGSSFGLTTPSACPRGLPQAPSLWPSESLVGHQTPSARGQGSGRQVRWLPPGACVGRGYGPLSTRPGSCPQTPRRSKGEEQPSRERGFTASLSAAV